MTDGAGVAEGATGAASPPGGCRCHTHPHRFFSFPLRGVRAHPPPGMADCAEGRREDASERTCKTHSDSAPLRPQPGAPTRVPRPPQRPHPLGPRSCRRVRRAAARSRDCLKVERVLQLRFKVEAVSALPLKLSHLGEEWVLDFRQIGRKMGSLVFLGVFFRAISIKLASGIDGDHRRKNLSWMKFAPWSLARADVFNASFFF